jgi:hypothetical protein
MPDPERKKASTSCSNLFNRKTDFIFQRISSMVLERFPKTLNIKFVKELILFSIYLEKQTLSNKYFSFIKNCKQGIIEDEYCGH